MRGSIFVVGIAACILAGCGGSGSDPGGVTGPGGTVNAVTVTLRDVVLMGTTADATATATLSNNQTQAVTSGWRSDATAVATVTDSGTVTGRANGEASIIVAFGGREGAKRIRVAPNYDGGWQGLQVVTACTATGAFAGGCEDEGGFIGVSFPISLNARQPGDLSVAGEFNVEGLWFPTFTTQVATDGGIGFNGTMTAEGIKGEVSWQINSAENGRATGTIREIYSAPGIVSGEITYDSNLSEFARGSTPSAAPADPSRSRLILIRKRIMTRR